MYHKIARIVLFPLLMLPWQVQAQQPAAPPDTDRLPFLSAETRYLWPTSASDYMSATFGETRSAHFHAAVDIGTWGRQGYNVYASRDGILSRIGISPYGYGNVIYLRHEDGTQSIYAHLRDFVPEIRQLADSIQFETYTADLDVNVEAYGIQFRKGDLIAFTGNTGIGPPHLHFELRSPINNPFNPLLAGIRVPDSIAPRFSGIAAEPINADSRVNESKRIARIPITRRGSTYTFGTIRTQGTIGLAVDVSDRADALRNVYAVYELQLFVNDSLYFHSRVDSFSYDKARQMFVDRVYPLLRSERKGYQRLFIRDGNTLPFYRDTGTTGLLDLPPGRHRVRIVARDYFGNESSAEGTVLAASAQPLQRASHPLHADTLRHSAEVRGIPETGRDYIWTNNWVSNPSRSNSTSLSYVPAGSFADSVHVITSFNEHATFSLEKTGFGTLYFGDTPASVHRVYPGQTTRMRTPDQRLELTFYPNTVFDTLSVVFGYYYDEENLPVIQVGTDSEPLKGSYELRFMLDEAEQNTPDMGMYRVSTRSRGQRSLGYAGSNRSGDAIRIRSGSFGTFTLAADTTAPELSRPRIFRRSDGKWFATVRVQDELSGVTHQNAEFYVNGVRGIAEYDPFGGILIYHHPEFRPERLNTLRIVLHDRSGNIVDSTLEAVPR
ncbi:MAG: Peptidase, M23/M37 family [Bacteroidetes bacterium HLUCCA01]|nr:MAG: Peptidase, M23/M37 family [Bacteroidetes bacterium HLUCCA01]